MEEMGARGRKGGRWACGGYAKGEEERATAGNRGANGERAWASREPVHRRQRLCDRLIGERPIRHQADLSAARNRAV
jgi:hypothetical protein